MGLNVRHVWAITTAGVVTKSNMEIFGTVIGVTSIQMELYRSLEGTAVAQWLRCRATNRKVAVSIPAVVIGNFH